MKVMIVVQGHPESSRGGTETAAYNLHQGLLGVGCDSVFLAQKSAISKQSVQNSIVANDREAEYFWVTRNVYSYVYSVDNSASDYTQLIRFIENQNPDVIHFHHYFKVGTEFILLVKNRFPNIKIYFTLHEYLAICGRDGQMFKTSNNLCYGSSRPSCTKCLGWSNAKYLARDDYFHRLFSNVDHFVSPSHFLKSRYVAWGIDDAKISVIENAQKAGSIDIDETSSSGNDSILKLGYFGQINAYKGLNVLLKAISLLPKKVKSKVRLNIYGSNLDQQADKFKTEIMEYLEANKKNVVLRGSYEPEQLTQLFAEIDTLVIPSIWWENSPMVIQEAFANNTPVICSAIGGMKEKINNGVDGLYCNPSDPSSLAEKIARLVNEPNLLSELKSGIVQPKGLEEIANLHLTNVYSQHLTNYSSVENNENCISLAS